MSAVNTANLQSLTTKQIAQLMNVSERSVYMARKVNRLAPHLGEEIMAGRMSLNEAHRLATNKAKPTGWDRLVSAFLNATREEQGRFVELLDSQEAWP